MTIKIVTDSTADLPPDIAQQLGISVVPLNVSFGKDNYKDGVDITADDFYRRLGEESVLPLTSAPSPGSFKDIFNSVSNEADGIISIHISSKLSGTYEAAIAGKREVTRDIRIEVVDSQSASGGLGLLVIAAAKLANEGMALNSIMEFIHVSIPKIFIAGALDTLKYLEKGGRIGKAQALVGSMLHIKPMISVRDGIVVPLEKVRTHAKAVERLYQLAAERMPAREIGVIYSTEFGEAEIMVKRLQELAPTQHIYLSRFGPCLGTYVGPGSLGVITLT